MSTAHLIPWPGPRARNAAAPPAASQPAAARPQPAQAVARLQSRVPLEPPVDPRPAVAPRAASPAATPAVPPADAPGPSPVPNTPAARFDHALLQHRRLFAELQALRGEICAAAELLARTVRSGGRVLFCGNNGAALDSQHLVADFNLHLKREGAPMPALALNADGPALMAIAREHGFKEVFARQLMMQGRAGDCLVAMSVSGESANVLCALQTARSWGMHSVALLGRGGGRARALADLALVVPHDDPARIQEAHLFIGHAWRTLIEGRLDAPV